MLVAKVPLQALRIKCDSKHLAAEVVPHLVGPSEHIGASHAADFSLPSALCKVQVRPCDVKVTRVELSCVGEQFGELRCPGLALAGPGRVVFPLVQHGNVQLAL